MAAQVPRRRAGPARLLMRRLGVLVVFGVVVYSLVRAVAGVLDGGDSVADGLQPGLSTAASPASTPASGTTDVDGTAPVVTQAPTTDPPVTEPPVTEPPNTGPPAPDNKAKVYIVGDSDAGTFGPYLERLLDGTAIVDTELNYKVSSGLARPDFYNWPVELAAVLPEADPDIVVATFGGNDSQGLSVPGDDLQFIVGDPVTNEAEWTEEYTRRAGEVMDLLLQNDRTVIWVGIPNDDNADVTARLAIQDRAAKAAAAARPDVIFIDTWTRFSGRDGNWAEFVIDPRDGVGKDVRADDGFHLNVTGAEILALDIAQAIRDDLRARGASI
ncbi:MAG: DUF459 domain-containing protein [Ilumatobacter sp.]|nr:DUF459 domain-containing protein [Ilumatobacter sp.]